MILVWRAALGDENLSYVVPACSVLLNQNVAALIDYMQTDC